MVSRKYKRILLLLRRRFAKTRVTAQPAVRPELGRKTFRPLFQRRFQADRRTRRALRRIYNGGVVVNGG